MRSGSLRHRITIEKTTETRDSVGGVVDSWTDHITTRASIEPLAGREFFQSHETQSETTHRIRMRWQAGITPKMRVKYDDLKNNVTRYFDIESVINVKELNREIHLMCKEELT